MRKRGVVLLLFLLAIGLGSLILRFLPKQEPHSQGRPLSVWINELPAWNPPWPIQNRRIQRTNNTPTLGLGLQKVREIVQEHHPDAQENDRTYQPRDKDAREAITQVGTNAIPHLLKWIRAVARNPSRLEMELMKLHLKSNSTYVRASHVPAAFAVLGSVAAPAVPELAEIYATTSSDTEAHIYARNSLIAIGPAAVPAFTRLAATTNLQVRLEALQDLPRFGADAASAIPFLIDCLNNRSSIDRFVTAKVLGHLQLAPELSVPALITALRSDDKELWAYASALGMFGPLARPAVPALKEARQSHHAETNAIWLIDDALHKIDPEAFAEPSQP